MNDIVDKIDELLKDDRIDTRAGLRFTVELIRDAFKYIEAEKAAQLLAAQQQQSIDTRLRNVERGLNDFLALRQAEQQHNEAERTKWRWAILTPSIALLLAELMRWVLNK